MTVVRMLLLLLVLLSKTASANSSPQIAVLELDDTIQPATLRYIERGLAEAAAKDAALVVIELDTPGGLLDSTRAMISAILRSPVPVAVYVTPSGGRAASAGFFLMLAADAAAMAPGTNTGAAHPVTIGQPREERETSDGEQPTRDPSLDKATEDAAAMARSLAERRKRPVDAAERAIFAAKSFTAEEAKQLGLVDIVAPTRAHLLRELDGRTITRFDGSVQTLALEGARVVSIEPTFAERVLSVIASPQIAYLLVMLGALALVAELLSPGLIVPGVVGGVSLLLGFYGLSVLPVSIVGALLLVAGVGLVLAEVFVTSYGLLAVGGLVSFVAGSLMLVEGPIPELRIGPEVVIPAAIVVLVVSAFLASRALRSRHVRPQSGVEAMRGERGVVVAEITPQHAGKVFLHGAYWDAIASRPVPEGTQIRVEGVDGLRLRVAIEAPIASKEGES